MKNMLALNERQCNVNAWVIANAEDGEHFQV
jgi:hypothetical protein